MIYMKQHNEEATKIVKNGATKIGIICDQLRISCPFIKRISQMYIELYFLQISLIAQMLLQANGFNLSQLG